MGKKSSILEATRVKEAFSYHHILRWSLSFGPVVAGERGEI